ncbi:DUF2304 domain-containing protein [Gorillibacterium sp. sgz5001074]|uniref:DUF2304 domain-containing protein n=1 Tax=Gorillibacterium sp. sgz5001074 TaxID=3446695 RepID=UPI003F67C72C
MPNVLHVFLLLCGLIFFGTVVSLLMRNKISEKFSLVWLVGSGAILVLSGYPSLVDQAAHAIGVDYAPSLLFLFSTLVLLLIVLYMSIQISYLNDKVKELAQSMALQDFEEKRREREQGQAGGGSESAVASASAATSAAAGMSSGKAVGS